MSTQDPSFHDRPGPDRPDRPDGGSGGFGSGPYGGGGQVPPGYGGGQGYGGPPRNGLGTAGLVCGIVAIALSFIPALNLFTWPVGVLAIVFGAVGWSRANKGQATNKGQAIAGLVLGIVSFLTLCLMYTLIGAGSDEYVNMVPLL